MNTFDQITQKIKNDISGSTVKIVNEASAHHGNNDYGLHIRVEVKSKAFEGKSLVDQHKMIQQALKDEIGGRIHSLSIKTST